MYNEEIKRRFINDVAREWEKGEYIDLFRQTEKYEEAYGIDVGEFNTEQSKELFENNFGITLLRRKNIHYHLVMYFKWRRDLHIPFSNAVESIDPISNNFFRKAMCTSPANLANRFDAWSPPTEQLFPVTLAKLFYEISYMGIDFENFPSLLRSDVDINSMKLTFNGKKYQIPTEFADTFNLAACSDMIMKKNGRSPKHFPYKRGSDYLFGASGPKATQDSIKQIVRVATKEFVDFKWSHTSIQRSGIFFQKFIDLLDAPTGEQVDFYNERLAKIQSGKWNTENKERLSQTSYQFEHEMVSEYYVWKRALIDREP